MGCGCTRTSENDSKNKKLSIIFFNQDDYISLKHVPINYNKYFYEDNSLDLTVNKIQYKLKELEQMRTLIVDTLDQLVIDCGASLFNYISIETVFDCIMVKLSNDNKGDIRKSNIKFLIDKHNYTYDENIKCSKETKEMLEKFTNYLNVNMKLKFESDKITSEIKELKHIHDEQYNKFAKELFGSNIALEKIKKIYDQNNKYDHIFKVIYELEKDYLQTCELKMMLLKQLESVLEKKSYDKFGKISSDDGVIDPETIIWDYYIQEAQKYFQSQAESSRFYRKMKENKKRDKEKIEKNIE